MSSSQLVVRPRPFNFEHPAPGLQEMAVRYEIFLKLKDLAKIAYDDFVLRAEQVATIILVDLKQLMPKGALSVETAPIGHLKDRLEGISPFCKHYMLYLDPDNIKKEEWLHAIPQMPTPQPRVTTELIQEQDWDKIAASFYYSARFKTSPELSPAPFPAIEEDICRRRSANRCLLTGNPNPKVFWLIPRFWNDTVEHSDATGSLMKSSIHLADVKLLDLVCSRTELGMSHKSWNMLCIDQLLYKYITRGSCAFKYGRTDVGSDGKMRVKLYFYWMPQTVTARFHLVLDKSEMHQLVTEFDDYCTKGCPAPSDYLQERHARPNREPRSGDSVQVVVSSELEAWKLECAVKVHWACIVFTALLGGAGQAYCLTGIDHRNGALQPSPLRQGITSFRDARRARQKDSSEDTVASGSSASTALSGVSLFTDKSHKSTRTDATDPSDLFTEDAPKK